MTHEGKTLWELLWEYDPNGLVVVDRWKTVTTVNPAFCRMFRLKPADILGKQVSLILDDTEDFDEVWSTKQTVYGREKEYSEFNLYVRKVIFPIEDQEIVACIMVDMTHEWQQRNEMQKIKRETIDKVGRVIDKQMKVAQEIAGLLGETTAETKVSLLQFMKMIEQETP